MAETTQKASRHAVIRIHRAVGEITLFDPPVTMPLFESSERGVVYRDGGHEPGTKLVAGMVLSAEGVEPGRVLLGIGDWHDDVPEHGRVFVMVPACAMEGERFLLSMLAGEEIAKPDAPTKAYWTDGKGRGTDGSL